MTGEKILVVEDDPKVVVFVVDQLEHLGYRVAVARDGLQGLAQVREEKPDLVVLDVMMPEMNGYEVCHRLKSSPETKRIPILMLTAKGQLQDKVKGFDKGADDYLPKPYDKAEFEVRVKALLKRSGSFPFPAARDDCTLSISCKPNRRINIRVSGIAAFSDTTKRALEIDPNVYARQADNAPHLDWRFNSKQWGKQLYQQILVNHPKILSSYNLALGEVGDEAKLHIRFEISRDLLRVPFEFLFEGIHAGGDYLVLRHPLCRSLTGTRVKRMPLSPGLFNDLWVRCEQLKILLIASNTKPAIPGVDQEIEALAGSLKAMFEDRGISVHVETIPTERATYEAVRNELQKCKYHIVHYAGHASYDRQSPEKSYLAFWEKPGRQGSVKKMPVSELQVLLRGSDLRFFYSSCCLSTKTGEPAQLLDDDFLGIADGIVCAGVPAILGFRWPVSDSEASTLASTFYESLSGHGQIDTALLDARCRVAARDRDDITWLSPILVMQA
jgi:DNA-binding response OmpR family regulator/CHAT domain-containing protein